MRVVSSRVSIYAAMPMCSAQCVSVELHLSYVKIKGSENEVDLL